MGFKIPYTNIQIGTIKNIYQLTMKKAELFSRWISMGLIVIFSAPIWLPIVIWKMGLVISDNFINYFIDD